MPAPANRRADAAAPPVLARRIRFVADPPAGAAVVRRYTQPRPCAAVTETFDLPAQPPTAMWPEPTDRLDVLVVPATDRQDRMAWLAPPDHPDAPPATTVEL